MKGNETIGTFAYDGLIIDGKHDLDVMSVELATVESTTTYARGTVLAKDNNGRMVPLGTTYTVGEGDEAQTLYYKPHAILTDETAASTSASVVTTAYKSGNFNKNKLIALEGYTITADDIEALREKGIFVEKAVD